MRGIFIVFLALAPAAIAAQSAPEDAIAGLVARVEQAGLAGDRPTLLGFGASGGSTPGMLDFAAMADPVPAKFVIKERDRSSAEGGPERLLIEVFVQRGIEARISTWRMDVVRAPGPAGWTIAELEQLSVISGLYRLSLNAEKQFDVRNLTVRGPDLTLELPTGTAFVAEIPDGPTAVVLLGRGKMRFAPAEAAEQTQLRIFGGDPALETDFNGAFLRVRPGDFGSRLASGSLVPRAVSRRDFDRASELFEEYVSRTLHLDLTDLSRERWSLTPSPGDLIAEIRTGKHGGLTYARSGKDAEDITLFDRRRRRNISVYASPEKLAARGRFYNEDDLIEYDVLHHDVEASFDPDRLWLDGRAMLRLRVRSLALTTLTLRLAEPLTVRSIVSPDFGHLLHLRVVGQNSVIVNLPATLTRDTELWLQVVYSGRLEPQMLEQEAVDVGGQQQQELQEAVQVRLEPQWVYSNRSYWHPQSTVTDYATGRFRITVPQEFDVVASGTPMGAPLPVPGAMSAGQRPRKMFVFEARTPARYFGCIISRFTPVPTPGIQLPSTSAGGADLPGKLLSLYVYANPRQMSRARSLAEDAGDILRYYASLLGDAPYPSFTLAIAESELPGGHSPPYFAVVNQTLPLAPRVWRNDPVSFENYPAFFLAHELAHQWWGQGVGWKNYHEQWLSEGFAQYFAVLYAANERGDDLLSNLMHQMRRWAISESDQGPVYLGYRLGHIKGDGRVFRALLYNKGAVVLHMLRRLMGDKAFFTGLRQFYAKWRYRKAGTDDFRAAMEQAGGTDLTGFFEAWVYGSTIPEIRFSYSVGPSSAVVRFEHRRDVVPVPLTVTITYADGSRETLVVPVLERVIERTLPLTGPVRSIDVNQDNAALAEIVK